MKNAWRAAVLFSLIAVAHIADAQPKPTDAERGVRAVLDAQVAAWNRADVVAFMLGYWKSDATTFAGSSGVLRGWQALLERYRRNYPGRKAMGTLSFSDLDFTPLGRNAMLVLGRWHLVREKDRPGGVFTLVARKFPEGWRIIHDHTSSVASAP